jgi:hypothetical protein
VQLEQDEVFGYYGILGLGWIFVPYTLFSFKRKVLGKGKQK